MFPDNDDEKKKHNWLQIFEIYCTNFFGFGHVNGIHFQTAKFKHSCGPNCEITWNENKYEIRTVSKIKSGEELRINRIRYYIELKPLAFRKNCIKHYLGYECNCDLCKTETLHGDNNR